MTKSFVYILKSMKNGRYYIGSTKDLEMRMKQHKLGRVKSTRGFLPIKVELIQEFEDYNTARKIESRLKCFKRKDFIEKIISEKIIKIN